VAVGSGGDYALAAARGILAVAPPEIDAEEIVKKAMTIASDVSERMMNFPIPFPQP
jgi:ATP-dependent protease HslVU (ClpYQ) peptidase subunit